MTKSEQAYKTLKDMYLPTATGKHLDNMGKLYGVKRSAAAIGSALVLKKVADSIIEVKPVSEGVEWTSKTSEEISLDINHLVEECQGIVRRPSELDEDLRKRCMKRRV